MRRCPGDSQGAGLEVDHLLARFSAEVFDLLDSHRGEPGHQLRLAYLRGQPRRSWRGLRGNLILVDQDHRRDTGLCEVKGDAGTQRA